MKAMSLWQPWASLIALQAKHVETRSWTTNYRGPLFIHASKKCIPGPIGDYTVEDDTPRGSAKQYLMRGKPLGWPYRLPLGEIVATCELVDVVPMVAMKDPTPSGQYLVTDFPEEGTSTHQQGGLWVIGYGKWTGGTPRRVERQRPYGDFAPGRFAWLLEDIRAVIPPVPAVGHQGLWNRDEVAA